MTLVSRKGESLVTSKIQRILDEMSDETLYVQTTNSLYRLRRAPINEADG